jgi:hypothetical protein
LFFLASGPEEARRLTENCCHAALLYIFLNIYDEIDGMPPSIPINSLSLSFLVGRMGLKNRTVTHELSSRFSTAADDDTKRSKLSKNKICERGEFRLI